MGILDGLLSQFQDATGQSSSEDVGNAATDHLSSADPQEFQGSVQEGVDGIEDHQVGGLASTILGALGQAGIPTGQIASDTGLNTDQPEQMGKPGLASLLGYAQQFAPGALGQAVASNPGLAGALGGPMLKGLLGRLTGG